MMSFADEPRPRRVKEIVMAQGKQQGGGSSNRKSGQQQQGGG